MVPLCLPTLSAASELPCASAPSGHKPHSDSSGGMSSRPQSSCWASQQLRAVEFSTTSCGSVLEPRVGKDEWLCYKPGFDFQAAEIIHSSATSAWQPVSFNLPHLTSLDGLLLHLQCTSDAAHPRQGDDVELTKSVHSARPLPCARQDAYRSNPLEPSK